MPVQMVPEIRLDAAAAAVQQLTHAVPGHAAYDSDGQQEPDGGLHGMKSGTGAEGVDPALNEFGAQRREEVGDHHQRHADGVLAAVRPEIGKKGPQLIHDRGMSPSRGTPASHTTRRRRMSRTMLA